jgi:hypothetical protein
MAEKSEKKEGIKIKVSPWVISTLILLVILAIFLAYPQITGRVVSTNGNLPAAKPANEVAANTIDYINKYILAGQSTAVLTNVSEKDGLYNLQFTIAGRAYNSYVTRDGSILFPSVVDMTVTPEISEEQEQTELKCEDIKKEDRASLQTFVVSYCPFGIQMQRILAEVSKSFGDYIKIRYIGSIENGKISSMHGGVEGQEAIENLRQICIREEQGEKYWDYISCFIKKGETESCLDSAKIDKTKLNTCMSDPKKGIAYAQEDFKIQNEYGISGSPTLVINGMIIDSKDEDAFARGMSLTMRSAEMVETLLCCGFNTEPDACSQKLNESPAATSFSETYSASGSASSGQC